MRKRIRVWNEWRKYSLNGPLYNLAVLFGFIKSPTFEAFTTYEDAFVRGLNLSLGGIADEQYKTFEIKFMDPIAQQFADHVVECMKKEKEV